MKNIISLLFLAVTVCLSACKAPRDAETLPTFTPEGYVRAVIEIPAGTNHKVQYHGPTQTFGVEQENGVERVIDFLPYPANYGFIPSTHMSAEKGGDGDPLDVFILASSMPTGVSVEIKPIAVMETLDDGELDPKIIAVPIQPNLQIMQAETYEEFESRYPAAKEILELWMTNYNPGDTTQITNWGDEAAAMALIEKWAEEE